MLQPFHIFAPAKVNLFLHVTGKRADGYHTLQSLMVFADVGDDLAFAEQDGFRIETTGPFASALPTAGDNLIAKAAQFLAGEYGVPLRGKITLTKNLPVASGIGGGSADAAAALRGLSRLWGIAEDLARLQKIGLAIGADVPACLAGHAVFAEGVGEIMTEARAFPALHLVLVNPHVSVPTASVFRGLQPPFSADMVIPEEMTVAFLARCRNDLTAAAIAIAPDIQKVLTAIAQTKACSFARMSGSGATCFGVYGDAEASARAAQALAAEHPDWWIRAVKTS